VVLPHTVKDGIAGLMLEEIQAAFQVTGLQLFNLPKQAAAEFLEVRICLCHRHTVPHMPAVQVPWDLKGRTSQ
jgi:hypothetical protein